MYRSRRELSNAYFLAKFGFDTAENEPHKSCHHVLLVGKERPLGGRARLRGAEPFRRARHLASRNPNLFSFFGKIWQTQCHFLARFGNSIVTFWQGLANTLKDSFLSLRNQLHNTTNHTGASRRTRRCCVEPQVQEPHSPTWTAVPAGSRSRRSILLTAFVSKSATFDRFY